MPLNIHELERIRAQVTAIKDWNSEFVNDATLNDVNPDAINYFIKEAIYSKRLPESSKYESIHKVLDSLNLMLLMVN